jgi:glycosyltransferase involved in cell wall biosynthesis
MPEHLSVIMPVFNERYLVGECIRRVLAVRSPLIARLDLIVVDDGSTDGTAALLRTIAAAHRDRITYVEHETNRGKGAAVRTGLAHARGSVTVIQDADLEYNPRDLPRLILPFVTSSADAVFGSRFLSGSYRRALYYRHTVGNRLLTTASNLLTDLGLTDMETCYKAVRTQLLKSIPLRSRDFRLEVELTFKLAKRRARVFEVPISYAGRTYEEGKKIGVRDLVRALGAMARWSLIDDIYAADEYGAEVVGNLQGLPQFHRWLAAAVRPYLGARVLELGAGVATMTGRFLPRDRYTVADTNPHHLDYLRNFAESKPYLDVRRVDPAAAGDFDALRETYDTVLCLDLLGRAPDPAAVLGNVAAALAPGGRAVVTVPHGPRLFGPLDQHVGHRRRYTHATLRAALTAAGLQVEQIFDLNRVGAAAWWLGGLTGARRFSRPVLKAANVTMPLWRRIDGALPWPGASLIAVARRGDDVADIGAGDAQGTVRRAG